MHSKYSPTRINALVRRVEMLQMVRQGMSYAAIGRAYGISRQRVHRIITDELQRVARELWAGRSG